MLSAITEPHADGGPSAIARFGRCLARLILSLWPWRLLAFACRRWMGFGRASDSALLLGDSTEKALPFSSTITPGLRVGTAPCRQCFRSGEDWLGSVDRWEAGWRARAPSSRPFSQDDLLRHAAEARDILAARIRRTVFSTTRLVGRAARADRAASSSRNSGRNHWPTPPPVVPRYEPQLRA